jgi:hypothetical protein
MKTQSTRPFLRCLVVGLSLTVGLGSVDLANGLVAQAESLEPVPSQFGSPQSVERKVLPTVKTALPDGVYLYGQSAEPDQMGKAYFVFEARQGKVLGAFYMPRSSFDCAYGNFHPDKVALTVIDSYEKTANPYEIALEHSAPVATTGNPIVPEIGLEGFNRVTQLSSNDQRILKVCQTNYPNVLK